MMGALVSLYEWLSDSEKHFNTAKKLILGYHGMQ